MKLILSEKTDLSTNKVMSWLNYSGCQVIRYNGEERSLLNVDMELKNLKKSFVSHNSIILLGGDLDSIWFRRPYNIADDFYKLADLDFDSIVPQIEFEKRIKQHYTSLKSFIFLNLSIRQLGSYLKTGVNKLDTLLKADQCGLEIPESIVSNSQNSVVDFLKKHSKIICKPIAEGIRYVPDDTDYWISNKTILIENEEEISKQFDVSLFQECLNKKYEIRIFYLDGDFYGACIFSQSNEKTMVDFRNYDYDKPNRIVPYELDNETKSKLKKLMMLLELNTGSIDLVKTKDGRIVFLEVNPVGQYGFISENCNYNLDWEIAKYLIGNDEEK